MGSSKPAVHPVKIIRKTQLNDKYIEVWLSRPDKLWYEAGQYLSVKVTSEGDRRSYSLISSPNEADLGLLIDTGPGGLGSKFFMNASPGEMIEVLLPMGRFIVREDNERNTLFVATGSGIAPMRGMIKEALSLSGDRKVKLVWGMRHEDDLFWTDSWDNLKQKYVNFDYEIVLSQPNNGWKGREGHVGDELLGEWSGWEAYVCGNGEVVKAVRDQLVSEGVDENFIYFEKFN